MIVSLAVFASLCALIAGGPLCACRNIHEQTLFCEHPDVKVAEFRVLEAIKGYWPSGDFVNESAFAEWEAQQSSYSYWYFYNSVYAGARYRIEMIKIYKGSQFFNANNSDYIQTENQTRCEGIELEVNKTYIVMGGDFVNKGEGFNNLWFYTSCDKVIPVSDLSANDAAWVRKNYETNYALGCRDCAVSDCRWAASCKEQGFWDSSKMVCRVEDRESRYWSSDAVCLPNKMKNQCRWYSRRGWQRRS